MIRFRINFVHNISSTIAICLELCATVEDFLVFVFKYSGNF